MLFTAFCVWLGMLASGARRQRLATEQLAKLKATVDYDHRIEELYAPDWLRRMVGDDFFLDIVEVRLHDFQVGRKGVAITPAQLDAAVAAMKRLPRLRSVMFGHTRVNDDDLRRLAPLSTRIESLYFNEAWSNLTGAGIQHFAGWPRLHSLSLHLGSPDKAALKHLRALPALKT